MKILEYRLSKETAYLIHAVFFNFYFLLIGRAMMVYSGMQLEKAATFSWQQRLGIIERLSEIIFFSAGMYNQ